MPQQVHFSSAEDMIRYVRQFGAHYMDLPTKFHTIQKNIDAYSVIMYSSICIQLATNVQICIVLVILFILQKSTDFVQFSIT